MSLPATEISGYLLLPLSRTILAYIFFSKEVIFAIMAAVQYLAVFESVIFKHQILVVATDHPWSACSISAGKQEDKAKKANKGISFSEKYIKSNYISR